MALLVAGQKYKLKCAKVKNDTIERASEVLK